MSEEKVSLLLHDVSSGNTLLNFVRTALAYKDYIELLVISRASGGAAQYGLAEASKMLYKEDVKLLVLPDIFDVTELFPQKKLVVFSRRHGSPFKSLGDIRLEDRSVILCFSGSETGFSKNELIESSVVVYPHGIRKELAPEAYLSIIMHLIATSKSDTTNGTRHSAKLD
uniref:Exonuclease n=1 Tax=Fervidicoccus fontis TaxID=683846 RepID=A0A7J3ZIG0_9CREN